MTEAITGDVTLERASRRAAHTSTAVTPATANVVPISRLVRVRDRSAAVADFLEPVVDRLAISRRYADGMRRIVAVLPKLATGRAGRFSRTEIFNPAVEVLSADLAARGEPPSALSRLRQPGNRRGEPGFRRR